MLLVDSNFKCDNCQGGTALDLGLLFERINRITLIGKCKSVQLLNLLLVLHSPMKLNTYQIKYGYNIVLNLRALLNQTLNKLQLHWCNAIQVLMDSEYTISDTKAENFLEEALELTVVSKLRSTKGRTIIKLCETFDFVMTINFPIHWSVDHINWLLEVTVPGRYLPSIVPEESIWMISTFFYWYFHSFYVK